MGSVTELSFLLAPFPQPTRAVSSRGAVNRVEASPGPDAGGVSAVVCPKEGCGDLSDLLAKGGFFHTEQSVRGVLKQGRIS